MSTPKYKRGPYNTYREKYHAKRETPLEEIDSLIKDLEEFRTIKIEPYPTSQLKSKVAENIQGLLDCFRKQKRKIEQDSMNQLLEKINNLENRIKQLESEKQNNIIDYLLE